MTHTIETWKQNNGNVLAPQGQSMYTLPMGKPKQNSKQGLITCDIILKIFPIGFREWCFLLVGFDLSVSTNKEGSPFYW